MTDAIGLFERSEYECFLDPLWRLSNLYYITDKKGRKIRFVPNAAQADFYSKIHEQNVILKARQLGFSTFIDIYALDYALFYPNSRVGIIAQGLNEAEDLFKNKIKFAYDNLPRWLRSRVAAQADSARKLEFSNGSSVQVGTSLRGGTFQVLHISEYGKIAARYPDKAIEIKTGALNTVHVGQRIFIESTAEGQSGEFFDLVERATHLEQAGVELSPMDPKLFFYGWYWDDSYKVKGDVSIDGDTAEYFAGLEKREGIILSPEQKSWYVKKREQQGEYMKREYPSTPAEAFEKTLEGAYFVSQMARVRENKQVTRVPWEPSKMVDTWWDLGINDSMTIWFFQQIGNEYRFIDYYEDANEGLDFYAQVLQQKGYVYGTHYWPHDGSVRDLSTGRARHETAKGLGLMNVKVLPRTKSKNDDIQALRNVLPRCWFDEEKCKVGVRHIDSYRKEWNDKLATWKDAPRHDAASHGVDPLLNFAVHYKGRANEFIDMSEAVGVCESEYDPLEVW